MKLFELILLVLVGGLCVYFGWNIWKKEKITLIHSYHYQKVSQKDKAPYTEKMGKAMTAMGLGIAISGIINFAFSTGYGWILCGISLAAGLIGMTKIQRKYNHGIF